MSGWISDHSRKCESVEGMMGREGKEGKRKSG